jgi:hypothetical protein
MKAADERVGLAMSELKQSNMDFREHRRDKFLAIGRSL